MTHKNLTKTIEPQCERIKGCRHQTLESETGSAIEPNRELAYFASSAFAAAMSLGFSSPEAWRSLSLPRITS